MFVILKKKNSYSKNYSYKIQINIKDSLIVWTGVSVRTSKVLHAALLTLATVGATLSFGLANAITAILVIITIIYNTIQN